MHINTFSIVARCQKTGQLGVSVSTAVPAVGSMCPYLRAGIGAVSTQSWVNPYLAMTVLVRLSEGLAAEQALSAALDDDENRDLRQIGVVDASGRAVSWTGSGCVDWKGHLIGSGYAVQGNMLKGEATLEAMASAFEQSDDGPLDERLMRALEAGESAGGDMRGKQSAAIQIVELEDYALFDLRVDEHSEPIKELRRVLEVSRLQLLPFVANMPTKEGDRQLPEETADMLLKPPAERPGGASSQSRTEDEGRLK